MTTPTPIRMWSSFAIVGAFLLLTVAGSAEAESRGTPLWTYDFGDGYKGTAARPHAGIVSIATEDKLLALDEQGKLQWTFDPGRDPVRGVSASLDSQTIAVTSGDPHGGEYSEMKVSVLSKTGGILWEKEGISASQWSRAYVTDDGSMVLIPQGQCAGSQLEAYNREGTRLWAKNIYETGRTSHGDRICYWNGMWRAIASEDNSRIFTVSHPNAGRDIDAALHAFNRQGTHLWSRDFSSQNAWSMDISSDGRVLYLGAMDSRIYAFGQDGSSLWSHSTRDGVEVVLRTLPDGSKVWVGSRDSILRVYNSQGALEMQKDVGDFIRSIDVSSDGSLVTVSTANGTVLVMQEDGSILWRFKGTGSAGAGISSDARLVMTAHRQEGKLRFFAADGTSQRTQSSSGSPRPEEPPQQTPSEPEPSPPAFEPSPEPGPPRHDLDSEWAEDEGIPALSVVAAAAALAIAVMGQQRKRG